MRLESLDTLRGISVAGMILVISPGSWSHIHPWLLHAEWEDTVLVDMIFPTFLFCVGMAIPFSLQHAFDRPRVQTVSKILYRGGILIALGVMINIPLAEDLSHLRLPGILQRIGVCYVLSSLIFLSIQHQYLHNIGKQITSIATICVCILIAYQILLGLIPPPQSRSPNFSSEHSWPAVIDRALFGANHLWPYGTTEGRITYDPDGFLASLPACVNVLVGCVTALIALHSRKTRVMQLTLLAGLIMMLVAVSLEPKLPIIKKLWTTNFALFSTGFSLALFSVLQRFFERKHQLAESLCYPFKVFGANALAGFITSWLVMAYADTPFNLFGEVFSLRNLLFRFWSAVFESPQNASLAVAFTITLFVYSLLQRLYQKKIYVRI